MFLWWCVHSIHTKTPVFSNLSTKINKNNIPIQHAPPHHLRIRLSPKTKTQPAAARSHIQADCDLNCTLWRSRRRMTFPEEFYDDLESCRRNKTFPEKTTNSMWTDPKRGGGKWIWNSTYHSIYEYPNAAGDIRRSFVPRLQLKGKKSSLLKCEDILWNHWPFLFPTNQK